MDDRRLVRELAAVIAVKLVLIALLWWGFVRDAQVTVTAADVAAAQPRAAAQQGREMEQHGQ